MKNKLLVQEYFYINNMKTVKIIMRLKSIENEKKALLSKTYDEKISIKN